MKRILTPLLLALLSAQMISAAWATSTWQLERPSDSEHIMERAENASPSPDGAASIGLGVFIGQYDKDGQDPALHGRNGVGLNISVTANSRRGLSYGGTTQDYSWISDDQLDAKQTLFDGRIGYDDSGKWVDFPSYFKFRFYGARDSGEYRSLWVCTNGFISFNLANSTSGIPGNILSGVVAPLWTDLRIDSVASVVSGVYHYGMPGQDSQDPSDYYVVIWKNALPWIPGVGQVGPRLTFEAVLQLAAPWPDEGGLKTDDNDQSDIYFIYNSVGALRFDFAYGVGDQDGSGGYGGLHPGADLASLNHQKIKIKQVSNNFFIESLRVSGSDTNQHTNFTIWQTFNEKSYIMGYHVVTSTGSEPDNEKTFAQVLGGTATLLIGLGGFLANVETMGLTLPIDFALVQMGWADAFAEAQSTKVSPLELRDENNNYPNQFYLEGYTGGSSDYAWSVDAAMNCFMDWIFLEGEQEQHSITITAQLNYYEYDLNTKAYTYKNWSTSVNLQMGPDTHNDPLHALPIQSGVNYSRLYIGGYDQHDYFMIHVPAAGNLITVNAHSTKIWPAGEHEPNFNLWLNDTNGNPKNHTTQGYTSQHLTYTADSSGDWYVDVRKDTSSGFYSIKVDISSGGGGGGCPYISSWNGSQFVLDNNLLPTSERYNGTDVEDYYKLEQPLLPQDGQYSMLINEFEHEHSYIDQVKLLAIDHQSNVHIAVDPDGNILTYKNPTAPSSAVDNHGNDRLDEITLLDGNVSDPSTYFNGTTGDYLALNFGRVNSDNSKLILRDDQKCELCCIDVQVLNSTGQWHTVDRIAPRSYWAVEGVNLSPYVIKNQDFKVRLVWTSPHRLDYVGLDTTKQAAYETHYGTLISATHSTQGDVTSQLLNNDSIYAELIPGQQIQLSFTLPGNTQEARTYILYTEGHYYTIP